MLERWEARLAWWRRTWSRSHWIARLLGPPPEDLSGAEAGLVLVQIDGFSRHELERALERGRMPFLRRLLRRERYRLHDFYSGLPATTFAVQAELFYGLKTAVPAVGFRIRRTGEVDMILDPEAAENREAEIAANNGEPLLVRGSAYTDALHGGAAEPHFCAAALTLGSILGRIRWRLWPFLFVLYFPTLVRIGWDSFCEVVVSLADAWQGVRRGHKAWHEFKFIINRVVVGVILREWETYSAQIDAVRGLPIIHVNYLGYDEKAHRRGPKTAFAHRALRGIDRSIRRLWSVAARSPQRDYDVWIYADHGQEQVTPYPAKFGRPLEEAVGEAMEKFLPAPPDGKPSFEIAAIGPVGYIYPGAPLDSRQCTELAEILVREGGVPTVLFQDEAGQVAFRSVHARTGALPGQTAAVVGEEHPFLEELTDDLVAMCRHQEAGRLVLLGWAAGEEPLSFAFENGAHGGPGLSETHAFALLPRDVPAPPRGYFRPLDLREAVQRRLGRTGDRARPERAKPKPEEASRSTVAPQAPALQTFRVVTYNVHSCIGLDGKLSPQRIARVIAQCDPDVVALQELDVGRRRTQGRDQAEEIARELNMTSQFFPTIKLAEEQYGDAILSRFPMRLVRSDLLPGAASPLVEPRGALWVAVTVGESEVQVLNTHLGLSARERLEQVTALLGSDWLGHPDCREPLIFCGDMNFGPRSKPYRMLAQRLRDVQLEQTGRPSGTFPSRRPLVRIDHIFVQGPFRVLAAGSVHTRLAVRSSDHLPLMAELRVV
jgi:endonuclease/exonuclease/phosphatase family metal-dependent hydrolase